jgi:hypothetical protein
MKFLSEFGLVFFTGQRNRNGKKGNGRRYGKGGMGRGTEVWGCKV